MLRTTRAVLAALIVACGLIVGQPLTAASRPTRCRDGRAAKAMASAFVWSTIPSHAIRSSPPADGPFRAYDLTSDGQRFLMARAVEQPPTRITHMVLVQNWLEELKARVPVN